MKTTSVAALALTALWERDSAWLEQKLQHLTAPNLQYIDSLLWKEEQRILEQVRHGHQNQHKDFDNDSENDVHHQQHHNHVVAEAVTRRIVFQGLAKFKNLYSTEVVEEALSSHTLPQHLQEELVRRYGLTKEQTPPKTWMEGLEQLKELASIRTPSLTDGNVDGNDQLTGKERVDKRKLWQLILDHPMTAYEPFRCLRCGQVTVQDVASTPKDNQQLGLSMVQPDGTELGLRGGWFRGRPYSSKTIFQLKCQECGEISKWYRSGHPKMLLNPARGWGRLCGEQEDLRLHLASYLDIPIRMCIPLDWDHVWTEFLLPNAQDQHKDDIQSSWDVHDDSARNFAVRLDQGIGCWTWVLAVNPNPTWCEDVSNEYLSCKNQISNGRADNVHASKMSRYREIVTGAQTDATGDITQAQTVVGYVLHRANWSADDVSAAMKRAANDYGTKDWWKL